MSGKKGGGGGGGPSAIATPISSATQLDGRTVNLLSQSDSYYVQQRIRWVEAVTQGCWEQPNVYDVFDKNTNKRIFVSRIHSVMRLSYFSTCHFLLQLIETIIHRLSRKNRKLGRDVAVLPDTPSFSNSTIWMQMHPNRHQDRRLIGPTNLPLHLS